MKKSRFLIVAMVIAFAFSINLSVYAQKSSRSSSSHSSSSRPSSSRPSSGSMFGGSKSSSATSSKPSSSGFSKPSGMFGGSKPNAASSSKPSSSDSNKPNSMFGGNYSSNKSSTINSTSSKPVASNSTSSKPVASNSTSSKPSSTVSTKAQAQKREESRQAYIKTQRATAPPKSVAVVGGRSVKVDVSSPTVTSLRNKPSTYIQPEVRRNRVINHVTINNYQHPYDYYYSRPVSYGVGPFSNAFWWMMMEWSAERRAEWLYHNQARISAEAYADAMRDAEVQRRLASLESKGIVRNANYVDPEFAADPTDMYDQSYVEAAYNPTPMPVSYSNSGFSLGKFFLWCIGIGIVSAFVGWLVFGVRWVK